MKRRIHIWGGLVILLVMVSLYGGYKNIVSYMYDNKNDTDNDEVAYDQLHGTVILFVGVHEVSAEIARTPAELQRGLSGREQLNENSGMLFVFPKRAEQEFWMKDMNIAIDLLWIRDDRIVGIERNMMPAPDIPTDQLRTYHSPGPVDMALEISAGWADLKDISENMRIRILSE